MSRSRRCASLTAAVGLVVALAACAETADAPDAWRWPGDAAGDARGVDAATPDGAPRIDGAPVAIVINEIAAVGDDFVELLNLGPGPASLAGLALTDDDAGAPSTTGAVRFADDAILPAGARLVIVANQSSPGDGPQTACAGLAPVCLHAGWGIGRGGDAIYLIDELDQERSRVIVPLDATVEGETWSRLPDGVGTFGVGRPTPGAPNLAP